MKKLLMSLFVALFMALHLQGQSGVGTRVLLIGMGSYDGANLDSAISAFRREIDTAAAYGYTHIVFNGLTRMQVDGETYPYFSTHIYPEDTIKALIATAKDSGLVPVPGLTVFGKGYGGYISGDTVTNTLIDCDTCSATFPDSLFVDPYKYYPKKPDENDPSCYVNKGWDRKVTRFNMDYISLVYDEILAPMVSAIKHTWNDTLTQSYVVANDIPILIGGTEIYGWGDSTAEDSLKYADHIRTVTQWIFNFTDFEQVWLWSDMLLDSANTTYKDSGLDALEGSATNTVAAINHLPTGDSIAILNWHYNDYPTLFPSFDYFYDKNFQVIPTVSDRHHNIKNFFDYTRNHTSNSDTLIMSTWSRPDYSVGIYKSIQFAGKVMDTVASVPIDTFYSHYPELIWGEPYVDTTNTGFIGEIQIDGTLDYKPQFTNSDYPQVNYIFGHPNSNKVITNSGDPASGKDTLQSWVGMFNYNFMVSKYPGEMAYFIYPLIPSEDITLSISMNELNYEELVNSSEAHYSLDSGSTWIEVGTPNNWNHGPQTHCDSIYKKRTASWMHELEYSIDVDSAESFWVRFSITSDDTAALNGGITGIGLVAEPRP